MTSDTNVLLLPVPTAPLCILALPRAQAIPVTAPRSTPPAFLLLLLSHPWILHFHCSVKDTYLFFH